MKLFESRVACWSVLRFPAAGASARHLQGSRPNHPAPWHHETNHTAHLHNTGHHPITYPGFRALERGWRPITTAVRENRFDVSGSLHAPKPSCWNFICPPFPVQRFAAPRDWTLSLVEKSPCFCPDRVGTWLVRERSWKDPHKLLTRSGVQSLFS